MKKGHPDPVYPLVKSFPYFLRAEGLENINGSYNPSEITSIGQFAVPIKGLGQMSGLKDGFPEEESSTGAQVVTVIGPIPKQAAWGDFVLPDPDKYRLLPEMSCAEISAIDSAFVCDRDQFFHHVRGEQRGWCGGWPQLYRTPIPR